MAAGDRKRGWGPHEFVACAPDLAAVSTLVARSRFLHRQSKLLIPATCPGAWIGALPGEEVGGSWGRRASSTLARHRSLASSGKKNRFAYWWSTLNLLHNCLTFVRWSCCILPASKVSQGLPQAEPNPKGLCCFSEQGKLLLICNQCGPWHRSARWTPT